MISRGVGWLRFGGRWVFKTKSECGTWVPGPGGPAPGRTTAPELWLQYAGAVRAGYVIADTHGEGALPLTGAGKLQSCSATRFHTNSASHLRAKFIVSQNADSAAGQDLTPTFRAPRGELPVPGNSLSTDLKRGFGANPCYSSSLAGSKLLVFKCHLK
jgi:hypothetical protein